MLDQAKMVMKMKKIDKELAKTIIEVDAGDGAVTVQMNGKQEIKNLSIDPESIDLDDISELERWVEQAFKKAVAESQKVAQEKMKPMLGNLGNLGL